MIHLITNIVEWCFVAGVFLLSLFPYLSYYRDEKSFKGVLVDVGIGYCVALQIASRDRLPDLLGTLVGMFLLAGLMPKFAFALAIYFFTVVYVVHHAIASGHKLGTIPASR